jgi:hypothetical protein
MGKFWLKHTEYQAAVKRNGADFGTVAGHQSIAELKDLIAIQDARMAAVKKSFDTSTWYYTDPSAANAWITDWTALTKRYEAAKLKAEIPIMTTPFGQSYIPAQDEFDGIMRAVQQVDGQESRGDLGELITRLRQAKISVDESSVPQPTAPDTDLTVRNKLPPIPALPHEPDLSKWKKPAIVAGVTAVGLLILREIL